MWTKNCLEAALQHKILDKQYNKITIDSRKINPGDVFIGIKGPNFNGSNFAADTIKNGASLAIVDHLPDNSDTNQLLVVEDTYRDGLMKLATYKRENHKAIYIGVTGSVGKTTTKDMLKLVLSDAYVSQGNLNNNYGLPLSLANMDDSQFCIFELGMSTLGEISFLSTTLRPNIAIITGIAPAHLANFSCLDDIAIAKSEIVNGLDNDGFLVVNCDSPSLDIILKIAAGNKVIGYSMTDNLQAQVCLIRSEVVVIDGLLFTSVCAKYTTLDGNNAAINYKIGGIGNDLVSNSLGVLSVLIACNLDANIINKLEDFSSVSGRGQIYHIELFDIQLIDESYNSNPTSLSAALHRVNLYSTFTKYKRKVVILGDMLELGHDEMQLHREMYHDIKKNDIDAVICVGPRMKALYDIVNTQLKVAYFENSSDAVNNIKNLLKSGDIVMVKGSNGMKMSIICNAIKNMHK